jgi:hypothetical protein
MAFDSEIIMPDDLWIIDSGSSTHSTHLKSMIRDRSSSSSPIIIANGSTTEFTGHMDVTIADANRVQIPVTLSNINYASHNLFSTSAAIRAGATAVLNSENGRIIMSDGTEFPLEHWNV